MNSVCSGSTSTTLCAASTRLPAAVALLQLRRASGCLDSSHGSSSTTSPTPRVRVPRHVARLIFDYFTYAARPGATARRAARHSSRHTARRAARRRLLRLRRATGCIGTSRSSSRSSTTSRTPRDRVPRHITRLVTQLVVDYLTYTTCPGASARHAACLAARIDYFTYAARPGASTRRAARRRLLRAQRLRLAATLALL
jgi:hypothetical protein